MNINKHIIEHEILKIIPLPTLDSGKYLTNNGSVLSWGVIASIPRLFDCVVAASGGDYTTIGAAITAGMTSIFVKDGTYNGEADITFPANCTIFGESKGGTFINLSTYKITLNANNRFFHCTIQSAYDSTVGAIVLNEAPIFEDVHFQWTHGSNPTNAVSFLYTNTGYDNGRLINCNYTITKDKHNYLLNLESSSADNWLINGLYITGGNNTTSQNKLIRMYGGFHNIENVWSTNSINSDAIRSSNSEGGIRCSNGYKVSIYSQGNEDSIENWYCENMGTYGSGARINNVYVSGTMTLNAGTTYASNFYAGNLTIGSSNEIYLSNFFVNSTWTNTLADVRAVNGHFEAATTDAGTRTTFQNCYFKFALTLNGNAQTVSNCTVLRDLTVNGDNVNLTNNRVGALAGGGSYTIIIAAAADNAILIGNRSDADISDSSSTATTQLIGNSVY